MVDTEISGSLRAQYTGSRTGAIQFVPLAVTPFYCDKYMTRVDAYSASAEVQVEILFHPNIRGLLNARAGSNIAYRLSIASAVANAISHHPVAHVWLVVKYTCPLVCITTALTLSLHETALARVTPH